MAYLEDRLRPRLTWYELRASHCKRLYLATEGSANLASIALIAAIPEEFFSRGILSVMAAFVTAMLAWQRIGRFGERWRLYRLHAGLLNTEMQLFLHQAGPYAVSANRDAVLAERTESILNREADNWLSVVKPEPGFHSKISQ